MKWPLGMIAKWTFNTLWWDDNTWCNLLQDAFSFIPSNNTSWGPETLLPLSLLGWTLNGVQQLSFRVVSAGRRGLYKVDSFTSVDRNVEFAFSSLWLSGSLGGHDTPLQHAGNEHTVHTFWPLTGEAVTAAFNITCSELCVSPDYCVCHYQHRECLRLQVIQQYCTLKQIHNNWSALCKESHPCRLCIILCTGIWNGIVSKFAGYLLLFNTSSYEY